MTEENNNFKTNNFVSSDFEHNSLFKRFLRHWRIIVPAIVLLVAGVSIGAYSLLSDSNSSVVRQSPISESNGATQDQTNEDADEIKKDNKKDDKKDSQKQTDKSGSNNTSSGGGSNGGNSIGSGGSGSGGSGSGGSSDGSGGGTGGGSGASGCPPYPEFPDANCTGTSGTLTTYSGPTTINTPGTVIENKIINTSWIRVAADNVTFRNVKINYNGGFDASFTMIYINADASGTLFDHCEIDGNNNISRTIQGGNTYGVTIKNSNIHSTGNAIEVGTKITARDNYIWDIYTPSGTDWHADGIQTGNNPSDISIVHNTIYLPGSETGAVNIISNDGSETITNVDIRNNLFAGGGYTIYLGTATARTTNVSVTNNHFSKKFYPKVGYWNIWYETWMGGVTRSGNVIHETGAPANSNL